MNCSLNLRLSLSMINNQMSHLLTSHNVSFDQFIFECLHPEAFQNLPLHNRIHSAMTGDAVPEHNTSDGIASGTVLAYDTETKSLEIVNEMNDKYYERERYIILGCLMRNSEWNTARILSPYFLNVTIDPKTFKTGKQLSKKLLSSVKDFTKWIVSKTGREELTVDILDTEDVSVINNALQNFVDNLDAVSSYAEVSEKLSNVLRDQSIVYQSEEDGSYILLGGFGPDYYASLLSQQHDYLEEYARQTVYKKMSTEEFLARARGEEWTSAQPDQPNQPTESDDNMTGHKILIDNNGKQVETDVPSYSGLNVEISYKDFLKQYSKADVFEFWCPIVFSVKID